MNKFKIAMMISIIAIPIFFIILSFSNKNQVLAVKLSDYSQSAQELIEEFGIPLENRDGFKLNESMLLKRGMVVYGNPHGDQKGKESRYLGYDENGNKYQNFDFPHDNDATGSLDKSWIKNPWYYEEAKNKGIKRTEFRNPEERQAALDLLNNLLDPYDPANQKNPPTGRTWLEGYNQKTGENWTAEDLLEYAVIHSLQSDFGAGSVTLWNCKDCGWWYQTFVAPPLKGFIDIPEEFSCKRSECGPAKTSGVTYVETYEVCKTDKDGNESCTTKTRNYYEYLSSKIIGLDDSTMIKAGQGFSFEVNTSYTNEYYSSGQARGPTRVVAYFPVSAEFLPTSVDLIPLNGAGAWDNTWILPEVYVEKFSGNSFYNQLDPNRDLSDELLNGGNKWYTPFKQKDGSYDFRIEVLGAGTTGLRDCKSECVLIKGSPFDDYVVRLVRPDNPFPTGIVGGNWIGNESIITDLTEWYYEKYEQGEVPPKSDEWVN